MSETDGFQHLDDDQSGRKEFTPPSELAALIKTYQEIGEQAGDPTGLVYPCGGFDIFPIVTDSVRMLKIYDIIPLAQSVPAGEDQFFEPTYQILASQQGEYIDIRSFRANPLTQINFDEETIRIFSKRAKRLIKNGFGSRPYEEPGSISHLGEVLGALYILGIDLDSVRIGMFGDEFRVAFQYGGIDKTVIFSSQRVDENFASSSGHELLKEQLVEFGVDNLMMISKADPFHAAQYVARGVRFNSIVCDKNNKIEGLEDYNSKPIKNPFSPELNWGYGKVKDVQILKK